MSETVGKLINRYQQASRCQQAFSKPFLVNLISKDTHLVFSISRQASLCQQAFSKPCLLNLISKDTHLVFSISRQASQCQQAFSKPCLLNLISKDTHLDIKGQSPSTLYISGSMFTYDGLYTCITTQTPSPALFTSVTQSDLLISRTSPNLLFCCISLISAILCRL